MRKMAGIEGTWVQFLASPQLAYMALGKSLNLSPAHLS